MSDCLFCQIARGEKPCYKIHEDADFLAFLDLFPLCEGHTLVIPKKHYRWVWDIENPSAYFAFCQKIANHYRHLTQKDLVISYTIGENVHHAHTHMVPGTKDAILIFPAFQKKEVKPLEPNEGNTITDKFRLGVK